MDNSARISNMEFISSDTAHVQSPTYVFIDGTKKYGYRPKIFGLCNLEFVIYQNESKLLPSKAGVWKP